MLKCIITLLIVIFCDARQNRIPGKYDQLILAQNPPLVLFFSEYKKWPNKITSVPAAGLSKNTCTALFSGKKWIIHGLWPLKIAGKSPSFCRTARSGEQIMKYKAEFMDSIFRNTLKTTWPDLTANRTVKSIWNSEWSKHGSCVTDNDSMNTIRKFFRKTVELLNKYNIGSILERSDIIPGNNYTLNNITDSLMHSLKKSSQVKCLPLKNTDSEEQYLLEVQICFNKTLDLIDCHRSGVFGCDLNQTVIYPKMKEN